MEEPKKKTSWLGIFRQTFLSFSSDKVFKLSAALAYYTIFSLPPMIIVIISVTGLIYGKEAIEGKVYSHLSDWVGDNGGKQIESVIRNVHLSGKGKIASIIGIITLIIGATGVFTEIQDSINTIWGVRPSTRRAGILNLLISRLLSFLMILSIGLLLVISLIANAIIASFMGKLKIYFPHLSVYMLYAGNYVLTFVVITVLFGTIYKVLPDAKIGWKDVTVGALATAILFMIGNFAIGFYLEHSTLASTYGAAGSIVIILMWVYYSSTILYFGAEFTQVYAHHRGTKITPNEYAIITKKNENSTIR